MVQVRSLACVSYSQYDNPSFFKVWYSLSSVDGGAEEYGQFTMQDLFDAVIAIFDRARDSKPGWYKETIGFWCRYGIQRCHHNMIQILR